MLHDEIHMGGLLTVECGTWWAGCSVSYQELSQLEVYGSQLQELPVRLLDLPRDLHLVVRDL